MFYNLFFYKLLIYLFYPLIRIYIFIRKISGKEDKHRYRERFAITDKKRPKGKIIWINAVSVGESNSAWSIIDKLIENSSHYILFTSTSLTSAKLITEKIKDRKYKNRVIHQFFPIDYPHIIKRFLKYWRPSILLNIENEVWPVLFTTIQQFCPIFILNGKMSKKSFRFWYRFKTLRQQIFNSNIECCLVQSIKDLKRFINLGIQKSQYLCNIKFFTEKLPVDMNYYNFLAKNTQNRIFWLVNCTHEGEEEKIIAVHKNLKKKYKNLLTMIVIRHENRVKNVENMITEKKLKLCKLSDNKDIDNNVDIYLHDKIGNLGALFEINSIVLMGGSLVENIGGHSPVECIRHNCCVITGPYIDNNLVLYKDLIKNNGCIILKTSTVEEITDTVDNLFKDTGLKNYYINNAFTSSVKSLNILNEIVSKILNIVE